MPIRSRRGLRRKVGHERPRELLEIHERMLAAAAVSRRNIDADGGRRVHLIEAGEGTPVLFLHGSSTSSLSLLPLIEHLEGVRAIAADRPGFQGLAEAGSPDRARRWSRSRGNRPAGATRSSSGPSAARAAIGATDVSWRR